MNKKEIEARKRMFECLQRAGESVDSLDWIGFHRNIADARKIVREYEGKSMVKIASAVGDISLSEKGIYEPGVNHRDSCSAVVNSFKESGLKFGLSGLLVSYVNSLRNEFYIKEEDKIKEKAVPAISYSAAG